MRHERSRILRTGAHLRLLIGRRTRSRSLIMFRLRLGIVRKPGLYRRMLLVPADRGMRSPFR